MAPRLRGTILDRAIDGSYVSMVGLSEEDQQLLENAFKTPKKKEESKTTQIVEKGSSIDITRLSKNIEEMSDNTNKMSSNVKSSANILDKGLNFIGGVFKERVTEEEKYHRALVSLVTQLKVTENIVNANSDELKEAAKSDENVARFLEVLSVSSGDRERILDKILDRQAVSTEDAATLMESLDRYAEISNKVNATLDVNLTEVIDLYKEMIKDDRIDLDQRREILDEIKMLARESGVSSEAIDKLQKVNTESLKFDKKTTVDTARLLSQVGEDLRGKKIRGTLEEFANNYDRMILQQKQVTDVLTREVGEGKDKKSFREKFVESPELYSMGTAVKKGGIASALHMTGLGALESIGAVDLIDRLFSKEGFKDITGKVKEGYGKVSGLFKREGKGIPGVEKVVGKGKEALRKEAEEGAIPQETEDSIAIEADKFSFNAKKLNDSFEESKGVVQENNETIQDSVGGLNKLLGTKRKKNTLIHRLDKFDDTLEDTAENIEGQGKKSGGLFGSLFGKKKGVLDLLGKGKGLLGGIGGKMTGGLGLKGLLGAKMGAIGTAGSGAIATSVAGVLAAAAAGFGIGTLLSKAIDKAIGRGKGGIGDWLSEKIKGTDEEISAEGEQKQASKWFAKKQDEMSPDAFTLLGEDPITAVNRFGPLRRSGQIVKVKDKWITAGEAEKEGIDISKAEKEVEKEKAEIEPAEETGFITEERIPVQKTRAFVESKEVEQKAVEQKAEITPAEEMPIQERLMQERVGTVTGKMKPIIIEETKETPAEVLAPRTTNAAQQRLMQERARSVATQPAINIKSDRPSVRKTSIDDVGIALFNSMVFE